MGDRPGDAILARVRVAFAISFTFALLVAAGACVGESPSQIGGGAPEPSTADAAAETPPEDGAAPPRDLGIFLTAVSYKADFAPFGRDAGPGEARLEVDRICTRAAEAVPGLPHAERYRALVASGDNDQERTYFLSLPTYASPNDRWCTIDVLSHRPTCTDATTILRYETLQAGPLRSLSTDQYGLQRGGSGGTFWSGLYFDGVNPAPEGLHVRNCNRWMVANAGGGLQGGVGRTEPSDAGGPFGWIADTLVNCGQGELPLLCMELPSAP